MSDRVSHLSLVDAYPTRPLVGTSAIVRDTILRLPERFLPSEADGIDATWALEIEGQPTFAIHVRSDRCLISPGSPLIAHATLTTDADTWVDLMSGRADGIRAFMGGRLAVAGDLNLAVRLETMFSFGEETHRQLRTRRTCVKGVTIESLVAGSGTPVLLLHGLAASKISFLPTFDGLTDSFEVHALDLPGFGRSDKPLPMRGRYSAEWMADIIHGYMVLNDLTDAYIIGNSMGGGIAATMAIRHPSAVRGVVGLCAAVAFDEWKVLGPLGRAVQMQWAGIVAPPIRRSWLEAGLDELFFDAARPPAANLRAAAADVHLQLNDRNYRLAVAACSKHLINRRSRGRRGFWRQLASVQAPTLWIWGSHDQLVDARYAEHVRRVLPTAEIEVWDEMGHAPQFEDPERTNATIGDFLARVESGQA